MPLNDLDQPQLEALIDALLKIGEATQPLHRDGLNPRIDLTPGNDVRITVGFTMPEYSPQVIFVGGYPSYPSAEQIITMSGAWSDPEPRRDWRSDVEAAVIEVYRQEARPGVDPSFAAAEALLQLGAVMSPDTIRAYVQAHLSGEIAAAQTDDLVKATVAGADHFILDPTSPEAALDAAGEVVPSEPAPAPEETPPAAVQSPAGGSYSYDQEDELDEQAFQSTTPSRSEDVSVAPKGTIQNAFGQTMWTAEEDARLVDLVVSGICGLGLSKAAAIRSAAKELGRPEPGTAFRCHHKLKERIEAALAEADAYRKQPEPTASPASPAAAPQDAVSDPAGDAAVGGHAPAAVQDAPDAPVKAWLKPEHIADEVTGHLMALPDKGGWTVDRDLELMELSIDSWQPNEIALQLRVQASAIKPRFDALTGLYEDANGKKVRRFTRDQVFAALQRLSGKAA